MATVATQRRTRLVRRAGRWVRRVHHGAPFDVVVGVGLVTYGLVYLVMAAIAVRLAVTGRRGADTPYEALDELAQTVVGEGLLWVTAVGLLALTVWQVFETLWRRNPSESALDRRLGRVGSALSAAGFLTLAVSAVRVAVEGRAAREGRGSPPGVTSAVEHGALRVAVVVAGGVLLVLAARSIYRGARSRFVDDLKPGAPMVVVRLGQGGHAGKGVTFAIIGGLMIWTAADDHVGPVGMTTVFHLINLTPSAPFLLLLKAAGLTLFGIYCIAWAANRQR